MLDSAEPVPAKEWLNHRIGELRSESEGKQADSKSFHFTGLLVFLLLLPYWLEGFLSCCVGGGSFILTSTLCVVYIKCMFVHSREETCPPFSL